MAIIYSYPLDNTPQLADLLLGTSISDGDATKSFTIGSLVALVDAPASVGTVTSVATANSTFISITGGPITNAGTLTASLSAGGTPNDTTFLRGDNQWAPATTSGSPNIEVFDEGTSITPAAASFNFTGTGVTATNVGDAVTVNVPALVNGVLSVSGGTGITTNATLGDIIVTNSGVIDLLPGNNIGITSAAGVFTVTATMNAGTVQSVVAGDGLVLQTAQSTITSTPTIGVQYTGSNNYILVGQDLAVIDGNDIIAFNQTSSSNVKSTTISTIPIAALPLVQTYIDAGDANTIKNNTDTFTTTPVVTNVITLTQAEYTALTPDTSTLYVIAAAGAAITTTLTPVTNSISGSAANYTITGAVNGSTFTGVAGETYLFTTIVTPNAGYYFSTPINGNVVSGTIAAGTTTVAQTLTGTLVAIPTPAVTATLQVVTNIQGGPSSGFVLGGNLTGAVLTGTSPLTGTPLFTTTCAPAAGYTFSVGPTIVQATGTIKGSQTVITTITGTLQLAP